MTSISRLGCFMVDRIRWMAGAKAGSAAVAQALLTRVFMLFINLATGVFTARQLGADGRGAQAAIGLWLPILTFVMTFGVPIALCVQGRKHPADRKQLFGAALLIAVGTGTIAALIGIALMPTLMHQYARGYIRDAQILMLFAPLSMMSLVFGAMLEVRLDFTFSNFTRYAPPVLTLGALLTLSALHALRPFTAVLAYIVPSNVISVVAGIYLLRRSPFSLRDFKRSARRLFGYGIRVFGSDIFQTFGQQIDQLLVVALLSASELGGYTIALQASRVLTIFQTSLNYVLLPKSAGLPQRDALALVARSGRLIIAITALAALALVPTLTLLIPGFYGHQFAGSVAVSQVLAIEAVFAAASNTHTQAFMATNRPAMSTLFQIGGLATAIPMMLLLIPRFGLVGAALALLTSTIIRLTLALVSYPILLKVPIPNLIITRADIRYLVGTVTGKSK